MGQCDAAIQLERVGDQSQNLLVLVQQQACSKVAQALVRKSLGRKQFYAFDLTEMGSFAEGKEVEEFGHIVPSAAEVMIS